MYFGLVSPSKGCLPLASPSEYSYQEWLTDSVILAGSTGMDFGQIAAQDDAAREQERARVLLIARGIIAVGEEIAQPFAAREPILIEAERWPARRECKPARRTSALRLTSSRRKSMRSGLITANGSFGSMRRGHAAHQERLRMRILAAQHGVDADEILLPGQRFQIMRHGQQVHFGRQVIGRMAPVAAGEQAQLAAVDHAFHALLHAFEIGRAGFFVIRNGLRDREVFAGSAFSAEATSTQSSACR